MEVEAMKAFFIQLDLLGPTPSLKIFKSNNFKTFKSAILSIIIIGLIIAFFVYSIIDFFKFENPIIVYWKDNTQEKNITINLKDKLFMIQINNSHTLNLNESSIQLVATVTFQSSIIIDTPITFERCEIGKNINIKHKKTIDKFEKAKGQSYKDYFCIREEDSNITLFNDQMMGENFVIISVNAFENFTLSPNDIYLRYVVQSDSINHFEKNEPLNPNYIFGETFCFDDKTLISSVINLNYIEYESDNGLFFTNNKIKYGIDFYNQNDRIMVNYYDFYEQLKIKKKALMGILFLRLNEKYFERYKRAYPKLQSLIADVISSIQLLMSVYNMITNQFYNDRMNIEIVKKILTNKNKVKKNFEDEEKNDANSMQIQNKNSINSKIEKKETEEIIFKSSIFPAKCTEMESRFEGIFMKNNIKGKDANNKNLLSYKRENKDNKEIDLKNNNNTTKRYMIKETNSEDVTIKKKYKGINSFNKNNNIISKKENNNNDGNELFLEEIKKINFWNIICCFSFCFKKKKGIIQKCNEFVDKEISIDNIIYKLLKLEEIYKKK